jgi:hypothetical protein
MGMTLTEYRNEGMKNNTFGWSLWKTPSDIDLWEKDLED